MSTDENIVAYAILVVEVGKEYEVAEQLRKIEGITEARVVYGEYDIVVRMEAKSIRDLERIVMTIRRTKGVLKSVTLIST
ncbi:MAG: AsnC family transcriptional regulator [Thermofilum sp. ex4484_79]|nr:MAG: AsnC family transcriptional regulator [Thermofilum sp. ex4484_79]